MTVNNKMSKSQVHFHISSHCSFHGWTGAGKNYVSRFIAEALFSQGLSSSFVHLFISTLHFPHADLADVYRLRVQDWIRGNVTKCAASLFIFDEVDKMPAGMIDGIKPFIDHHTKVEGVDFRRSIFLFLSNTGGRDITRESLKVWEGGRDRESLQYGDLEHLVNQGAFNELGGLHHSSLIDSSLIDVFLPFLPLERKHVRLCVEREAGRRNITLTAEQVGDVEVLYTIMMMIRWARWQTAWCTGPRRLSSSRQPAASELPTSWISWRRQWRRRRSK